MKVSVTMMTKNGDDFIQPAIESVIDYVDEFIVCDTGSTDRTIEIVKEYPIRFFEEKCDETLEQIIKKGSQRLTDIRNILVSKATGDWIMILDQDEVWDKPFIKYQIQQLSELPERIRYVANRSFTYVEYNPSKVWFSGYQIRFFKNNLGIRYTKSFPNESLTGPHGDGKAKTKSNTGSYLSPFFYHHFGVCKKRTRYTEKDKKEIANIFEYKYLLPEVMR